VTGRAAAVYNRDVRKFVLMFLMVLLPLQWSAAAMAMCCADEPAAVAQQNLGDDERKHDKSASEPLDGDKNGSFHSDCATCLACCAHAVGGRVILASPESRMHGHLQRPGYIPDLVPESLFRPPVRLV
jgi:hypothetical protein